MSQTTILCLPYAGAGATFYRGWPPPPAGVRIVPLQPAGREERYHEDPYPSLAEAVDDLGAAAWEAAADGPYLLFGHSFGAILAFEIARRMCVDGGRLPAHLVVSGSAAPGVPLGRRSVGLADDEFVARVEQLAGYVHPALADPDLSEVILPVLRADVELHESYRPTGPDPLPVPITVLRGDRDHLVGIDDCHGWAAWTSRQCEIVELPGGHMHLAQDPQPVLRLLSGLAPAAGNGTVSRPAGGPEGRR